MQVKRLFEERRQHKRSQAKARQEDRIADCKDAAKEFSLSVKAATPKRKISTIVAPNQVGSFETKMNQVVTQGIFRQVLERQERERKDKKNKKGGKKEESKTAGKAGKRDAPGKIKKNRRERRKDLAKQQKKVNL